MPLITPERAKEFPDAVANYVRVDAFNLWHVQKWLREFPGNNALIEFRREMRKEAQVEEMQNLEAKLAAGGEGHRRRGWYEFSPRAIKRMTAKLTRLQELTA